jgi:uncharacterized protein
MFDRDLEWSALGDFATDPGEGAMLGVVSGRRRQGKTFLLMALCEATGGFYFAAEEAVDGESLRRLGEALAEHLGAPPPLAFSGWHEAVDALLALGRDRPVLVVVDEFPYLAKANPSLPSIIQNALAPLRRQRVESRTRLLLCGSAMSFMGRLLGGGAPLRGRAGLELVVPTLDHRLAARFRGLDDPATALKVNATVGGTPAYRREFGRDDTPSSPDDFDAWVVRTVLSPASPLFREARYLPADEPDLRTQVSTTRSLPRSSPATRPVAVSPPTWGASPVTSRIRSPSFRTADWSAVNRTCSRTGDPTSGSPNRSSPSTTR